MSLFRVKKIFRIIIVFIIIFAWLFSDTTIFWQIGNKKIKISPRIKQTQAAMPSGIIVAWPYASSTLAGTGWYRDPALDNYFLKKLGHQTNYSYNYYIILI